MINPALRPDASLPEYLAARARASSDGRLVVDVIMGACAAIAVAAWRPTGWLCLIGASVCFVAFGAWGIADRELGERADGARGAMRGVLVAVRTLALGLGVLAAALALFAALALTLGTWIS
jgi:hypothetical protein